MNHGYETDFVRHIKRRKAQVWSIALVFCFLSFPSLAQELTAEQADRSCAETLNALDWTLEEPGAYFELGSLSAGAALHGIACAEIDVIDWFAGHGWTLRGSNDAPGGVYGLGARLHRVDRVLSFCLPRWMIFRALGANCAAGASVSFYDGRVTQIYANMTK